MTSTLPNDAFNAEGLYEYLLIKSCEVSLFICIFKKKEINHSAAE